MSIFSGANNPGVTLSPFTELEIEALQDLAAGEMTAGGSNTQVQYNSSGLLAGSSLFTFNGSDITLLGQLNCDVYYSTAGNHGWSLGGSGFEMLPLSGHPVSIHDPTSNNDYSIDTEAITLTTNRKASFPDKDGIFVLFNTYTASDEIYTVHKGGTTSDNGTALSIIGDTGGSTAGSGGQINITAGAATSSSDQGGSVIILGGVGTGTSNGGNIDLRGGLAGDGSTGARLILGGGNWADGGDAELLGGFTQKDGETGATIFINAQSNGFFTGVDYGNAAGGDVRIRAGAGGRISGAGGNIDLYAGNAQSGDNGGNDNGGSVRAHIGSNSGSGTPGAFMAVFGEILALKTYFDGTDYFTWFENKNGFNAILNPVAMTSDKTFSLLDQSGTLVTQTGNARATAQTAANTNVLTFTVGAADGTFTIHANVLVTTSTAHSFGVTVTYTDESNTSRVVTVPVAQLAGTLITAITNITGAGPYEGVTLTIRAKSATNIIFKTAGTFTTVTYNVDATVVQIA